MRSARSWSVFHAPKAPITTMSPIVNQDAGSNRRNRRAQKPRRSMESSRFHSRSSSEVMRNPESVKNAETPR